MNDINRTPQDQPQLLLTRKMLREIAQKKINEGTGEIAESVIYDAVLEAIKSASRHTLQEEAAWAVTRSVIDSRSTPHLTDNDDWIGYGDMTIKLPDNKIVKVKDATKLHLVTRLNNVKANLEKITKAAAIELKRIKALVDTMDKHGFETVGKAIELLNILRPDIWDAPVVN